MTTLPTLVYEESIEMLTARAVAALINADTTYFQSYYRGTARVVPPSIQDDLIRLPDCLVQNVIERDAMNRMIGGFAKPSIHVRVLMFEMERTAPYADGDTNAIVNRIVHLEKLLERGSLGETDECTGVGLLINPNSTFGDPFTTRFLNDLQPLVTRFAPQRIDLSPTQDQSLISIAIPLVITYQTRQQRLTRRGV